VSKNASKRKNVRFIVPRCAAALIKVSVPEHCAEEWYNRPRSIARQWTV